MDLYIFLFNNEKNHILNPNNKNNTFFTYKVNSSKILHVKLIHTILLHKKEETLCVD